ncbi:hypothetical protein R3P38DRAFT_2818840, partial [Favolaschia claudopus]
MGSSYLYDSTFHLCFLKLALLTGPFVFALQQPSFCRPHTPALVLPRHTQCTHTAENLLLPAFGPNSLPPSTQ